MDELAELTTFWANHSLGILEADILMDALRLCLAKTSQSRTQEPAGVLVAETTSLVVDDDDWDEENGKDSESHH